jgi:hypothetical protein
MPWSRVIIEELVVAQLVKKFCATYTNLGLKFCEFTRTHHNPEALESLHIITH